MRIAETGTPAEQRGRILNSDNYLIEERKIIIVVLTVESMCQPPARPQYRKKGQ